MTMRYAARVTTVSALALLVLTPELLAQAIRIDAFTLQPAKGQSREMKLGDDFDVGARVTNRDAGLISYVLRTVDPVALEDAPPALNHYEQARRFVARR